MYRESGELELIPIPQRKTSEVSIQLFKWIEISGRLEELDLVLEDEEESPEFDKLWDQRELLPNFGEHNYWNLFDDKLEKEEVISSPCFYPGSACWYLKMPEKKEEKKDYSTIIGFLIGLAVVAIWYFVKYGNIT